MTEIAPVPKHKLPSYTEQLKQNLPNKGRSSEASICYHLTKATVPKKGSHAGDKPGERVRTVSQGLLYGLPL